MKSTGSFFKRLLTYVIAAIFIMNIVRFFRSGVRVPFFGVILIAASVFLLFTLGLMRAMFATADDEASRSGERPADANPPARQRRESQPSVIKLTLPSGNLAPSHPSLLPLAQEGVDLEEFCRLFNEASAAFSGSVQVDVTLEGNGVFSMRVFPSTVPAVMAEPRPAAPAAPRRGFKQIAAEIGSEAELREYERREREELKRLGGGK